MPVFYPTPFYVDSTSGIFITKEDAIRERSRHIDWKNHYIWEKHRAGEIDITHVPTNDMLANFLTKPLCQLKLDRARVDNMLGLILTYFPFSVSLFYFAPFICFFIFFHPVCLFFLLLLGNGGMLRI